MRVDKDISMEKKLRSVDFVVVGTQKCATSWLYYCLSDHPAISMPPTKNDEVYLGCKRHRIKGDRWYKNEIGDLYKSRLNGDISVNYLLDTNAAQIVRRTYGDVDIIVSIRSPIKRAVSAYYWNLRLGFVDEFDINKGLSKAVKIWRSKTNAEFSLHDYYYNIIERGIYYSQVKKYCQIFGAERVHIITMETIKKDSKGLLKSLYDTLGVESDFVSPSIDSRPKKMSYNKYLIKTQHNMPNWSGICKIYEWAHNICDKIGIRGEKQELDSRLLRRLKNLYKDSNKNLRRIVEKKRIEIINERKGFLDTW
jgi:hypothetical protein